MDQARLKGTGKQGSGLIKEATGKVTGDTELQAKEAAEKAAGKVQYIVGHAKDAARSAVGT